MRKSSQTVAGVVFQRLGYMRGARVVGVLAAWSMYLDLYDQAPTQRQLEGLTKRSQASWSRDLALFVKAFPGEESPERIVRLLVGHVHARKSNLDKVAAQVASCPASVIGV